MATHSGKLKFVTTITGQRAMVQTVTMKSSSPTWEAIQPISCGPSTINAAAINNIPAMPMV